MKRSLLIFLTILSVSCTVIETDLPDLSKSEAIRETLRLKSADSLFYHAQTGLYISLNSNALALFTNSAESSARATHLAVKFYPKSREEQHYLSNLEGVSVSYIPFGYDAVKADRYRKSDLQCVPVFAESNPNTITISGECEVDSIDGSLSRTTNEPVTLSLPVMYAIWPIGMPLPTDIEYQIVYRFTMPEPDRAHVSNVYPLQLVSYDSLLGQYVPLRNVRVSITTNGLATNKYTISNGSVQFMNGGNGSDADFMNSTVSITLESPKWTIARDESTTPIHVVLGRVSDLWLFLFVPDTARVTLTSATSEYEIHRAVDYYHYSGHELKDSISTQESGVIIHAYSTLKNGSTTISGDTSPSGHFIRMYNIDCTQSARIASVCHELGHIRHYQRSSAFDWAPQTIKESYATFVGWYLGWDYYLTKGFIPSSSSQEINWQARQEWTPSSSSPYTPLFVDLNDDYNQKTSPSSQRLDDPISSVPIVLLDYIGSHCTGISDVGSLLRPYAGTYFTLNEINNYLQYYE